MNMPELDKDVLKKIDKNIVKCITELGKKDDINPSETKALLDGLQTREWIACQIEECEMKEQEDSAKKGSYGYSGHGDPYRRYSITAYNSPSSRSDYENRMMPRYSGDYGVEGWYRSGADRRYQAGVYPMDEYGNDLRGQSMRNDMSRGMSMTNNGMSNAEHREYSRHSVADRIINIIEKSKELGDMTPFEQDEVRRVIRMIRTAE